MIKFQASRLKGLHIGLILASSLCWIFNPVLAADYAKVVNSLPPGSDIRNGFETDGALSGWSYFNNCSTGSSANRAYTAPEQRIEGEFTLRLQTLSFAQGCANPGMYALSPAFPVISGQTVRVGSYIRNGTYQGHTLAIFYDKSGTEVPVGSRSVDWAPAATWDWPNWHEQTLLTATAPTGAASFRVRFDLISPNAIIDIDALQVSGDKFKGVLFNPQASDGTSNLGAAWQLWLTQSASVLASVTRELDQLLTKTHMNLLYIMVNTSMSSEAGKYTYPIVSPKLTTNLAAFVKLARSKGVQVGILVATHCVVNDDYPVPPGQTRLSTSGSGFGSCGKSEDNIQKAAEWYQYLIRGTESQLMALDGTTDGIAFWEMGGNPMFGAAELPIWEGSGWTEDQPGNLPDGTNGNLGVKTFVGRLWPHFRGQTSRPTAFTAFPINIPGTTMTSSLVNFRRAIASAGAEPDYYIFTSSPMIPLDADSPSVTPNSFPVVATSCPQPFVRTPSTDYVLKHIPASKVILGDFQWQQRPIHCEMNPLSLNASKTAQFHFDLLKTKGLAGWWIWSFRDERSPDGSLSEGLLDTEGNWKDESSDPRTSTVVNGTKWPYSQCPTLLPRP